MELLKPDSMFRYTQGWPWLEASFQELTQGQYVEYESLYTDFIRRLSGFRGPILLREFDGMPIKYLVDPRSNQRYIERSTSHSNFKTYEDGSCVINVLLSAGERCEIPELSITVFVKSNHIDEAEQVFCETGSGETHMVPYRLYEPVLARSLSRAATKLIEIHTHLGSFGKYEFIDANEIDIESYAEVCVTQLMI